MSVSIFKMASSRERMFTASQVCRLLDEDSDVSSDIEIEVKTLNICVGCHDVYLFLQSDMPCHDGVCCLTVLGYELSVISSITVTVQCNVGR